MNSKYEMSAMEYLLRYGKNGKKQQRTRMFWHIVWIIVNVSLSIAIIWACVMAGR